MTRTEFKKLKKAKFKMVLNKNGLMLIDGDLINLNDEIMLVVSEPYKKNGSDCIDLSEPIYNNEGEITGIENTSRYFYIELKKATVC